MKDEGFGGEFEPSAGLQNHNKTMASGISNIGFSKLKPNLITLCNFGMFRPPF